MIMNEENKSPITVKDVIEHLKTFPPDMEVWNYWDEAGTYHIPSELPGKIVAVAECFDLYTSPRWTEYQEDYSEKFFKTSKKVILTLN